MKDFTQMNFQTSKEFFQILFRLSQKQPWLSEKEEELLHLLFEDCQNESQKGLLIKLLNDFEYVSHEKYKELIRDLVKVISSEMGLNAEETQIVALASDEKADSSQYLLYDLKIAFDAIQWKPTFVNRFGAAYKTCTRNPSLQNIILVDEFIGSGMSAEGRINEIKRQFLTNGISDVHIHAKFLIGCETGINRITPLTDSTSALITLRKGISDRFTPDEAAQYLNEMQLLETLLASKWGDDVLPSLGYGGVQALYFRKDGNTPNNVFPIFWWPLYKSGNLRRTLLRRAKD
jgi:hypothetical protein